MERDVSEVLVSQVQIEKIVARLAARITADYQESDLVVIGILKGANVFMSDLIRKIKMPISIDFMAVSSYGNSTESSGVVKINKDLDHSIENRDVLIVEDIVDTGLTLNYLIENLQSRGARSVRVCALLDKPERRRVAVAIDYKGIEVPDVFVVGYGIDYSEKYRNLPYVAILKETAYQ